MRRMKIVLDLLQMILDSECQLLGCEVKQTLSKARCEWSGARGVKLSLKTMWNGVSLPPKFYLLRLFSPV